MGRDTYRTVTKEYDLKDVKNWLKQETVPILRVREELLNQDVYIDTHSGRVLVKSDIVQRNK